ncbi:MAG: oligopeptidase A [Proteobacteria bacterium]|nr:MAG: oligopeptidase A [Pseudomonadota bacterium]
MKNYLLETQQLPSFSKITADDVEPALEQCLKENRDLLDELLRITDKPNWDNFILPLERVENRLSRMWSPVSHMNAVVNTPELRKAYNDSLPKLSEFSAELGQNKAYFAAIRSIQKCQDELGLSSAQRKSLNDAIKGFRRSGIDLDNDKQAYFKEIDQKLSQLCSKFSDNILDATNDWVLHTNDKDLLKGLPESALSAAAQSAKQRGLDGWLLTLEFPSFHAVMSYADDRALREKIYTAYITRASDQSENTQFDNNDYMVEILKLRQEKAQLLGFKHYADYSVDIKMADSHEQVIDFLEELAEKSHPHAVREFAELAEFAKADLGIDQLEAWDVSYASDKLKQKLFDFSNEDLKPYFPTDQVLKGLFSLVESLYNIKVQQRTDVDTWHPDVRFYEILNADGCTQAQFYLDLYARQHKRGGAWMADYCARFRDGDNLQIPVAFMTCNSSSPTGDKPALFTHDEVITLFHEFGHGLHHMLTEVEHLSISGIRGVEWDAVELPSQFMENWCWQRDTLNMFAAHYDTGEKIPDALFKKMQAAQHFQSAMGMVRQLEFALFDLRVHMNTHINSAKDIQDILNETRKQVAVIPAPEFNRFQNSFTHIFSGGYAAGYYSYKWAEVLSADAFARFEEEGLFSPQVGKEFLSHILQQGGSRPAMQSFVAFRGRKPHVDALLRHNGLLENKV